MLDIKVSMEGLRGIDFDRAKIRKTLRALGRDVQKEARRLVARRALSGAGDYPGRQTGALWRSIKYRVSKPGFLVRIQPDKTQEIGADFYPAFLNYGSRKRNLEKRRNYMAEALESRRASARSALRNALLDSFKARR